MCNTRHIEAGTECGVDSVGPFCDGEGHCLRVVISELVQPTLGTQLVELYNASEVPFDLAAYECSLETFSGEMPLEGELPAHGFFSVASSSGCDVTEVDLCSPAFSLRRTLRCGGEILDRVSAVGPGNHERRATADATPETMCCGGIHEFAGNAFDTDSSEDFIRRVEPDIQNTSSSPERPPPP